MKRERPRTYHFVVQRFLAEAEAEEDYVGLWQIFNSVGRGRDEAAARRLTLDVVRALLAAGLRPGKSPYQSGGFELWAEESEEAIVRRIESEWRAGQDPNLLDVWFSREQGT